MDIKYFRIISTIYFWIFIHFRQTQWFKTHVILELKFKFQSQPRTPCCIFNFSGWQKILRVRLIQRASRCYFFQKTQRAATSTRAPEAFVPPLTRNLRARETLKAKAKFADEFSWLGSMKIKLFTYTAKEFIIHSHIQTFIFRTLSSLLGWSQTSRSAFFLFNLSTRTLGCVLRLVVNFRFIFYLSTHLVVIIVHFFTYHHVYF